MAPGGAGGRLRRGGPDATRTASERGRTDPQRSGGSAPGAIARGAFVDLPLQGRTKCVSCGASLGSSFTTARSTSFGEAAFYGTLGGSGNVIGIIVRPTTAGYTLVQSEGTAVAPTLTPTSDGGAGSTGPMGSRPQSTPNGIRTRAAAVKGRCPRPLDDGGRWPAGRPKGCDDRPDEDDAVGKPIRRRSEGRCPLSARPVRALEPARGRGTYTPKSTGWRRSPERSPRPGGLPPEPRADG